MSYEEQLSAAKFRADRDQARQDACVAKVKLDRAIKELGEAKRKAGVHGKVISDQNQRIHELKREVEKLRCELDAASKDAAERSKILEAARWVRDHGGLAHIMDIVNDFRAVVERIGVEWSESELHAIMGVLDSRLMPEGYEWSDGFAGAVDFFEAMHDLLYTIDGEEHTGPEMVHDVMARLMPKGYEWPRYESGEPVRFGDVGLDVHGKRRKCYGVKFTNDGFTFVLDDMGRAWWGNDCGPLEDPEIDPGKRVKRPAVIASDDDGCCDPGTYRCQEAAFTCDSCGHTVFVDKCMVDEIRYLRAKGIRTLNCCCGHGGKVEPFIIVNEGDECRMLDMGYERRVNEHGVTYFMPKSSCPPKAIAADGEPLEVGQTAYDVDAEADTPLTVVEVSSDLVRCEYTWKDGKTYRPCYPPSVLTHTKPEPPDSWERIEEDAGCTATKYNERRGTIFTTKQQVARDLVRRCRALAERERGA